MKRWLFILLTILKIEKNVSLNTYIDKLISVVALFKVDSEQSSFYSFARSNHFYVLGQ